MAEKTYRRLPGSGRGMIGIARLWLGHDHLLAVHSTGYSEDYKRFYFRDIQAIITRKTEFGKIVNAGLVFLSVAFLAPALAATGALQLSLSIAAAILFLALLLNWWRGPTCVSHIRTAVQIGKLPSLNRLNTVRKVLGILRPMVEQAQGTLTPGELQRPFPDLPSGTEIATTPIPAATESSNVATAQAAEPPPTAKIS
ncbi:MAG: hypothetical protein ABI651_18630 [Verrucomicrobiota bacterium]